LFEFVTKGILKILHKLAFLLFSFLYFLHFRIKKKNITIKIEVVVINKQEKFAHDFEENLFVF